MCARRDACARAKSVWRLPCGTCHQRLLATGGVPIMVSSLIQKLRARTSTFRWAAELYLTAGLILCGSWLTLRFPGVARRLYGIEAMGATPERRTLLIVSYYAAPYKSKYGTQRISKFAKFLAATGWKVIFLVTSPLKDYEIDLNADPLPENVEVVRIDAMPKHPFDGDGMFPPDDFVFWVPHFTKAILKILAERQVDLMLATVPPYSVALAAALASARAGVPLVCDFRDPWSKVSSGWMLKSGIARWASAALERGVLKIAKAVVMVDELRYVSDYFADSSRELRDKVVSIRNGYDDDDFAESDAAPNALASAADDALFVISYVGVLYSEENASNILSMFECFSRSHPDKARRILLEYAGGNGAMLTSRAIAGVRVVDNGYLSHSDAIALRKRSAVQLFAQPATTHAHVSSGKIYEMIRSGVPILALTRSDGTVTRLIEETRTGSTFDPREVEGAANALGHMFDQWVALGKVSIDPDLERIGAYSRKSLTGDLSSVLVSVADNQNR